MAKLDKNVQKALAEHHISYEVLECKPDWADTAVFCEQYDIKPENCANTIVVASRKATPVRYATCIVLAPDRIDVNKSVRKLIGVKRASFATPEQTKQLTGMLIGGVTPFGLPSYLPVYIDSKVMNCDYLIMGGGNRSSKLKLNPQELNKLPQVQVIKNLSFV